MNILNKENIDEIVSVLNEGKICVLPTDTVYGLHCLAFDNKGIEKIHLLKKEDLNKPLINLISCKEDIKRFGISLNDIDNNIVDNYWPGPNTVIFKKDNGDTVSFRLPNDSFLISILEKTGPLVSTSANIHGLPSACDIEEASNYFEDNVDLYIDGGILNNPPSSIFKIEGGNIDKIR